MRQSDAAAALAILCGTLFGAELFRQRDAPQDAPPTSRVQIVEVPVQTSGARIATAGPENTATVILRVTSTDPDRQARFRMILDSYPDGKTTEVVTPFTLTSTRSAIVGRLTIQEGSPDIRATVTVEQPGLHPSQTITVSGDRLRVDSEGISGGSLPGSR